MIDPLLPPRVGSYTHETSAAPHSPTDPLLQDYSYPQVRETEQNEYSELYSPSTSQGTASSSSWSTSTSDETREDSEHYYYVTSTIDHSTNGGSETVQEIIQGDNSARVATTNVESNIEETVSSNLEGTDVSSVNFQRVIGTLATPTIAVETMEIERALEEETVAPAMTLHCFTGNTRVPDVTDNPSGYSSELSRLLTYPDDFLLPYNQVCELVKSGFYHTDNVKCAFCTLEVSLDQLAAGDDVHHLHQVRSSECPLIVTPTLHTNKTFLDRERDLRYEQHRLQTFLEAGWSKQSTERYFVGALDLAKSGFYFMGISDKTRCTFCRLEVHGWEEGDTAEGEHRRWNSSCPYLQGYSVGNVPLHQENNLQIEACSVSRALPVSQNLGGKQFEQVDDTTCHPEYKTLTSRVDTYEFWPVAMAQKPKQLSEAGFYYTGIGDHVKCYQCGGGLKDWSKTDDPWVEHAVWFPSCAYVLANKGQNFIKGAKSTQTKLRAANVEKEQGTQNIKTDCSTSQQQEVAQEPERENDIPHDRVCKVCMDRELRIVFLPCGHMASCTDCASRVDSCPICRTQTTAFVRAYLS